MPKYDFDGVADAFALAKAAVNAADPTATKAHDLKAYAAIYVPVGEVKEFYEKYDKTMATIKAQAKMHMDAIENTLKQCKGKPADGEWRLLRQSSENIEQFVGVIDTYADEIKKNLQPTWRGVWDTKFKAAVFNAQPLLAVMSVRKGHIDRQTSVWNPIVERVKNYESRAKSLLAAAEKAAQGKGGADAALPTIQKAYTDCLGAGPKGVDVYLSNMKNTVPRYKVEAAKGIPASDLPKAVAIWKSKAGSFEQFEIYGKTFRGAQKTLGMILQSIATASKTASKENSVKYAELKKTVSAKLKEIEDGLKSHTEGLKYIKTITEQYKVATARR